MPKRKELKCKIRLKMFCHNFCEGGKNNAKTG